METGQSIVFYSWQSDLPNPTNRGFIKEALKKAVKTLKNDDTITDAPRLEHDTFGVPGSPDISQTIFEKIDQAHVFVCDISIINKISSGEWQNRPTPNPNVLIELGYALKALGSHRIIMLCNTAYGGPELLPFDLRPRRILFYEMSENAADRATKRKLLEDALTESLRIILRELSLPLPGDIIESKPLVEQVCLAVSEDEPTQVGLCRQYMKDLAEQITALAPRFIVSDTQPQAELPDELLVRSLEQSTKLVSEFIGLTHHIALIETSQKAAMALYKGFENILNLYTYSSSVPTYFNEREHDFAKFLGHELFVVFFASLIREERWELVAELLDEEFYARIKHLGQLEVVPFTYMSQSVILLEHRDYRLRQNYLSLHADLLKERYTEGELKNVLSYEDFMAADYFLYLRSEAFLQEPSSWPGWIPWSTLYMTRLPYYVYKAERIKYAQRLEAPLGVQGIPRMFLKAATEKWKGFWRLPRRLESFDFHTIGSRP